MIRSALLIVVSYLYYCHITIIVLVCVYPSASYIGQLHLIHADSGFIWNLTLLNKYCWVWERRTESCL